MTSTSKLKTMIVRTLRRSIDPANPAVHFHLRSDGRPFVCDVHACNSAAVTFDDLRIMDEVAR